MKSDFRDFGFVVAWKDKVEGNCCQGLGLLYGYLVVISEVLKLQKIYEINSLFLIFLYFGELRTFFILLTEILMARSELKIK